MNPFQGMALPRRVIDRVTAHAQRMHAASQHASERIEAAQDKRDRKNAKRRRDSIRSLIGSKVSRQLLNAA